MYKCSLQLTPYYLFYVFEKYCFFSEGSEAQLDCVVGRVSPSLVAWYKDNNCIVEKEGVKILFKEETSSLLLSEARVADSGQYTVTVFDSNKTTSTSTKVELVVKGMLSRKIC